MSTFSDRVCSLLEGPFPRHHPVQHQTQRFREQTSRSVAKLRRDSGDEIVSG